ncbi:MAG: NADH-quinone oxidoreductase subunit L [Candidatus Bipolaricaulia bacterium]
MAEITHYAWLIPIFPLLAAILITASGRRMWEGGGWVAIAGSLIAFVLAVLVIANVLGEEPVERSITWFESGDFKFEVGILIDNLTALMLGIVTLVGTLVVIYSIAYMHGEGKRKPRYYAEISLFIGVMLGLVLANNYLELFIFWELVGLCSYLLIGFWYERPAASAAAMKAFLVTRVGDLFFLFGIVLLFFNFRTLNFGELFSMEVSADQLWILGISGLFIFLGAVGKSAQFPLHVWLPDAMEGPSTVSALIHAATMVKAGIYLVARSYPLLIQHQSVMLTVAAVGGFTALLAATMALVNNDIKRVLAFSTISQLGYMMLGLGAGGTMAAVGGAANGYTAGLFHLMNHAFFKALLFLGAGSVMHAVGTTDLRQMGALHPRMRITSITMLIASLSIAGVPPFSGFWSKDELLGAVFEAGEHSGLLYLLWAFGVVTVLLTAFYMFRLWYMTFGGRPRYQGTPHESPPIMTVPLAVLAVLAFGSGFVLFGGFGDVIHFGDLHFHGPTELLSEIFTGPLTYLSLTLAGVGIAFAYWVYHRETIDLSRYSTRLGRTLHTLLVHRYYLSELYAGLTRVAVYGVALLLDRFDRRIIDGTVNAAVRLARGISLVIDGFDRWVVDGLVNGIGRVSLASGRGLRRTISGYVQDYASWVVAGMVALWIFYIVRRGW